MDIEKCKRCKHHASYYHGSNANNITFSHRCYWSILDAEKVTEDKCHFEWEINDFLKECEELCRNPYTYNYDHMPSGFCNGHKVGAYDGSWHSIIIDGAVCTMAYCTDENPDGNVTYVYRGKEMTWKEYVREKLTESVPFSALMYVNPQFEKSC